MKKEIIAGLILLALFAGSLINIRYLKGFIGGLDEGARAAVELADGGDFSAAEEKLSSVINDWLAADGYTHILIRHTEIDSTTDAFFELLSDIRSEDAAATAGSFGKLRAHLDGLYTMERISLGSIF